MKRAILAALVVLSVSPVLQADLKQRVLRGEVVVKNNGGDLYNLVVLVDSFSRGRKRDGNVDHVFGIRSDESYGYVNERLRDAHVTVDGRRVTIYSPDDDRALVFAMSGEEDPEWLSPDTQTRTFTGHSMVGNEGDFGLAITEPKKGGFSANLVDDIDVGDPSGGGSSSCAAGGSGSGSCSISCRTGNQYSCEVSCTGNNYACCYCDSVIGARCKCRLNT